MRQISCIIPTHNEEEEIGKILRVLAPLTTSVLKELIVVDDFSSDNTRKIVQEFPEVVLLEHTRNEGKSKTIADGIKKATGDYILMLDGDLIGLTEENVCALIYPVLNNQADITISYRGNTPRWWIRLFEIETFSGERCFARKFLTTELGVIETLAGYGLEVYMNNKIIERKFRIKSVAMDNVKIKFKWHKHGVILGIQKEMGMWRNIFSVVSPLTLAIQVLKMQKLLVRNI